MIVGISLIYPMGGLNTVIRAGTDATLGHILSVFHYGTVQLYSALHTGTDVCIWTDIGCIMTYLHRCAVQRVCDGVQPYAPIGKKNRLLLTITLSASPSNG